MARIRAEIVFVFFLSVPILVPSVVKFFCNGTRTTAPMGSLRTTGRSRRRGMLSVPSSLGWPAEEFDAKAARFGDGLKMEVERKEFGFVVDGNLCDQQVQRPDGDTLLPADLAEACSGFPKALRRGEHRE